MQGKLKKITKKTEPGSGSVKRINAQALYIINFAEVAYHQNFRFAYHHCESIFDAR